MSEFIYLECINCKTYIHDSIDHCLVKPNSLFTNTIMTFIGESIKAYEERYHMDLPQLFEYFSIYTKVPNGFVKIINENPIYLDYLDKSVSNILDGSISIKSLRRIHIDLLISILLNLHEVHTSHY